MKRLCILATLVSGLMLASYGFADEPKQEPKVAAKPAVLTHQFYVDHLDGNDKITAVTHDADPKSPVVYLNLDWPGTDLKNGQVFRLALQPVAEADGNPTQEQKVVAKPAVLMHEFYVNDIDGDGKVTATSNDATQTPVVSVTLDWPESGLKKGQVFKVAIQPVAKADGTMKIVDVEKEREHLDEVELQQDVGFALGITKKIMPKMTPAQQIEADIFYRNSLQWFNANVEGKR